MVISQPEPDYALSDFCLLALTDNEDAPPTLAADAIMDDLLFILHLLMF